MALDVPRRLGWNSVCTVLSGYLAAVGGAVDPPKCSMDGWTIGMGQRQARIPDHSSRGVDLTESRSHRDA